MPYKGQGSSATAHIDILKDPTIRENLDGCTYTRDVEGKEALVEERLVDAIDWVRLLDQGCILATDGSTYEAAVEARFPSVQVGVLKLSQVIIDIGDYRRLRDERTGFVDPVQIAKIQRQSSSAALALPGTGLTDASAAPARSFLRRRVFEVFRAPSLSLGGQTLYDTFCDLLARLGRVVDRGSSGGGRGILFKGGATGRPCPATGDPLAADLFVPLDPGWASAPTNTNERCSQRTLCVSMSRLWTRARNLECYNRFMTALEHILLAHLLRCVHATDPTVTGNLNIIVDGPLAIFGQAASFHRGIMALVHEVKADCRRRGLPGPLVIGISKTGKIVEHAQLIGHVLARRSKRTLILPVDDAYRYQMIEPATVQKAGNFGDETYYGQNFLVRTSQNKVFDACFGLSFPHKAAVTNFPAEKVRVSDYGDDLARMVSVIEMMQTDLYENALIAVHLAHKYASIAHSPGGRTLDNYVRAIVKQQMPQRTTV